jgi:flagellar assembly protein FliH
MVLSGEQLAGITRWEQPAMEGGGQLLTARQLESLQQQAYEEAHAAGYAAGKAEAHEHLARFDAIMRTLARPLEELDARVEEELVALAIAVAKQLIRRELRTDPGEVVAVVRDALALLPVGVREVRVHLHPEDADSLRPTLASTADELQMAHRLDLVLRAALPRRGKLADRCAETHGAVVSRLLGGDATRMRVAEGRPPRAHAIWSRSRRAATACATGRHSRSKVC